MGVYILISAFCVIFGTAVVVNETQQIRKNKSVNLINVFGYMYGVTYGFFPVCVLMGYAIWGNDLSHGYYRIDYSPTGLVHIVIWVSFSVFGYLAVQIAYKMAFARKVNGIKQEMARTNLTRFEKLPQRDKQVLFSQMQTAMVISFFISVISLFLWTRAYGGLLGLIQIADKVRDGDSAIKNSIAFFMRPAKMILIVFYMAFVLVKYSYKKRCNVVFLIISFVLSILMLLALDGRLGMAMFFITTVLLAQGSLENGNFSWKKIGKIVIVGAIALIGILNMDDITFLIRNGYWKTSMRSEPFAIKLLSEFSYIITGAQHAIAKLVDGSCPYLVGHDILAGLFSWVPSAIRPDGIIDIWDYNTEICTIGGILYGQLPCDFITTSVYALGIFGPVAYGVFWGFIIKLLDVWHLKSNNPVSNVFYCAIAMRVFRLVNYCLLYDFVLGSFNIVLAAGIWWLCSHVRIKWR